LPLGAAVRSARSDCCAVPSDFSPRRWVLAVVLGSKIALDEPPDHGTDIDAFERTGSRWWCVDTG
jgi:hypothetical protein